MHYVDHSEVRRLLSRGAQVADVLPRHEYDQAHLPGAIHLPLSDLLDAALKRLDPNNPVVVYCRDSL